MSFLSSEPVMDDRRAFFRKFFPKWKGFREHSFDEIQLVEALQNLQYLVEGMLIYCTRTSNHHFSRNHVDENELDLSKVGVTDQRFLECRNM